MWAALEDYSEREEMVQTLRCAAWRINEREILLGPHEAAA